MKKAEPLVSVVMPVYNRENYVADAIESVLGQTFADFEFIIVDDASTDGSLEILKRYAAKDSRIRLLQHRRNLGTACARNTGIHESTGAYVTSMDSDDVSLPRRLEKQVELLNEQPSIGGVGVDGNQVTADLKFLQAYNCATNSSFIALNMLISGPTLIKATVMTRREYIDESKGFRPELKSGEDYEFYLRMVWMLGIRYTNISEVLYLYRVHGANSGDDPRNVPSYEERIEWPKREAAFMFLGEMSDEIYRSISLLRPSQFPNWIKMSLRERLRTRRNVYRLIDAMIEKNAIDAADRDALREEVDKRIEKTMPRRWQQFIHWRRKRLGR